MYALNLQFPQAKSENAFDFRACDRRQGDMSTDGQTYNRAGCRIVARCDLSIGCPFGADREDWSYHTSVFERAPE